MVSRYSEALEQRTAMYDRCRKMDTVERLTGFNMQVRGYDGDRAREHARVFVAAYLGGLRYGDPYYWTADMSNVMRYSVDGFPEDYQLQRWDLPTETGFFWFERPILMDHYDGVNAWLRAVSWVQADKSDAPIPLTLPISTSDQPADSVAIVMYLSETPTSHAFPMVFFPWMYGLPLKDQLARYADRDVVETSRIRFQLQLFGASLMFLSQKVIVAESLPVERNYARRLRRRKGPDILQKDIRVIYLRRQVEKDYADDKDKGEAYVRFTKRWFVSPHWRRQWYPSQERHVPIRISGYVKGPEDAPLDESTAQRLYVVKQ